MVRRWERKAWAEYILDLQRPEDGLVIDEGMERHIITAGETPAEIVEEFPELELADIGECLSYAAWLASGRTVAIPPAA